MLRNRFLLLFICLMFPLGTAISQNVELKVKMDSNHIVIGDQLTIHLSLTTTPERNLLIEGSEKWKLQNCEIVSSKAASSHVQNNQKIIQKEVVVTSFDTGVAIIAPILVFENDTLPVGQSEEIRFYIDSLPVFVDTTKAFKDIKLPVDGRDVDMANSNMGKHHWGKIILILLLVLLLIGAIVFVVVRYLVPYIQKRRLEQMRAKLKENAGTVAMKMLKDLRQKKLWQKGRVKDYYSELSMILRTYMDHQWSINAKEMVTDEILSALEGLSLPKELQDELQNFLQESDLVKFAKALPSEDAHVSSMKTAVHFVQVTDQMERDKSSEQSVNSSK